MNVTQNIYSATTALSKRNDLLRMERRATVVVQVMVTGMVQMQIPIRSSLLLLMKM